MTNRKDWPLGASSCLLNREIGHTDEGFAAYERAGIRYAELSPSDEEFEKMRFLEDPKAVVDCRLPSSMPMTACYTGICPSITDQYGLILTGFATPFCNRVATFSPLSLSLRH